MAVNVKHLEFIQTVINRHNTNSFMVKGWAVTVVSAINALAGSIKDPQIAIIAIGPTLIFWILDAYFLSNERCFTSLYLEIINPSYKRDIPDFSMNFKEFRDIKRNNWNHAVYARSVIWYYIGLILLSLLLFAVL